MCVVSIYQRSAMDNDVVYAGVMRWFNSLSIWFLMTNVQIRVTMTALMRFYLLCDKDYECDVWQKIHTLFACYMKCIFYNLILHKDLFMVQLFFLYICCPCSTFFENTILIFICGKSKKGCQPVMISREMYVFIYLPSPKESN